MKTICDLCPCLYQDEDYRANEKVGCNLTAKIKESFRLKKQPKEEFEFYSTECPLIEIKYREGDRVITFKPKQVP